ncbi:hypothetical protein LT493_02175 [Streptomyces tricolor]|nr:hypothetical protein [Streptomyces tricolor]
MSVSSRGTPPRVPRSRSVRGPATLTPTTARASRTWRESSTSSKATRKGCSPASSRSRKGPSRTATRSPLKCPPLTKVTETYRVIGRPPNGSVDAGFGPAEHTGAGLTLGGGLLVMAAAGGAVWMYRRPHGNRT